MNVKKWSIGKKTFVAAYALTMALPFTLYIMAMILKIFTEPGYFITYVSETPYIMGLCLGGGLIYGTSLWIVLYMLFKPVSIIYNKINNK